MLRGDVNRRPLRRWHCEAPGSRGIPYALCLKSAHLPQPVSIQRLLSQAIRTGYEPSSLCAILARANNHVGCIAYLAGALAHRAHYDALRPASGAWLHLVVMRRRFLTNGHASLSPGSGFTTRVTVLLTEGVSAPPCHGGISIWKVPLARGAVNLGFNIEWWAAMSALLLHVQVETKPVVRTL